MPSNSHRLRHWILAAAFMAGIGLPLAGTLFGWGISQASEEERVLAQAPALPLFWRSPTKFYAGLKGFLTDGFGFRAPLVRLHSRVMVGRLRASPNPKVALGQDGWLYLASERTMEDYTCVAPFAPAELEAWRSTLEQRGAWLAARGIPYVVAVAPNAQTIYPEHLPHGVRRLPNPSRLDQLTASLAGSRTVTLVDLRPALAAARRQERIYCQTDTHWNPRGALVAVREILEAARGRVPGLRLPERDQFRETYRIGPGGDLARMLGLREQLHETWIELQPLVPEPLQREPWPPGAPADAPDYSTRRPGAGPGLLLFCDSFGKAMKPFLSGACARATYLSLGKGFDQAAVEALHPDLVVQEFVERRLMSAPGD